MTAADKASLERSTEHITKVLTKDAKVSERDLHDRLLKQARMQENLLYDEAARDGPDAHKRPALSEAPGGFTQMPAALKQAAAQLEYYHTFSGIFPQIHRAWMTIDHILFLWDYTDPRAWPGLSLGRASSRRDATTRRHRPPPDPSLPSSLCRWLVLPVRWSRPDHHPRVARAPQAGSV